VGVRPEIVRLVEWSILFSPTSREVPLRLAVAGHLPSSDGVVPETENSEFSSEFASKKNPIVRGVPFFKKRVQREKGMG